jgi:hypothetical protein
VVTSVVDVAVQARVEDGDQVEAAASHVDAEEGTDDAVAFHVGEAGVEAVADLEPFDVAEADVRIRAESVTEELGVGDVVHVVDEILLNDSSLANRLESLT